MASPTTIFRPAKNATTGSPAVRLKVIDLQTNEVMAERIGYMMDRGQGDRGTAAGRRGCLRPTTPVRHSYLARWSPCKLNQTAISSKTSSLHWRTDHDKPDHSDYLKYANLQMAAEAFLVEANGEVKGGIPRALKAGNKRSLLFTETQATAFADQWEVVDQRPIPTRALAARCSKRSTKPIPLNSSSPSAPPNSSTTTRATTRPPTNWNWPKAALPWARSPTWKPGMPELAQGGQPPLAGKTYSVTGYSLGGHLATVFNQLRQAEIQQGPPRANLADVITFNGAGVGQIGNGSLSAGWSIASPTARSGRHHRRPVLDVLDRQGQADLRRLAGRDRRQSTGAHQRHARQRRHRLRHHRRGRNPAQGGLRPPARAHRRDLPRPAGQASRQRRHSASVRGTAAHPPRKVDDVKIRRGCRLPTGVIRRAPRIQTPGAQPCGGRAALFRKGGIDKIPGTPAWTNQYDVVGWEYSAAEPGGLVAHTLWHYGRTSSSSSRTSPMAQRHRRRGAAPPWPRL
jgi:hypothetical protein